MKNIVEEMELRLISLRPSPLKIKNNSASHASHHNNKEGGALLYHYSQRCFYRLTNHRKTSPNSPCLKYTNESFHLCFEHKSKNIS